MSYIGNSPTSIAFLTDTFSGNGSTTAFTLSAAPATTSSILVAVSGVLQDPSTYSSVGTTLNFSAAPPSGTSNISVRFLGIPASGVTTTAYRTSTEFTATASQTTFSVPSYTVGFIDVYRNGVMLGSADYTATNGTTVVLATGATSGDLIEVISFQVSSVLNAIPNSPSSVGTSNLVDGSVTTAKILDSNVTTAKILDANVTPAKLTTNGSGGFTLPTSAGNAVVADSAGRVTMPFQPAFHATRDTAYNANGTVIVFPDVSVNIGSGYNSSNGRFTAPVAGTYIILVSFFTNIINAPIDFRITVNGGSVGGNATTGNTAVARDCHAYVIRTLAVNDYIEVLSQGFGTNIPGGLGIFQTFSGHLIG